MSFGHHVTGVLDGDSFDPWDLLLDVVGCAEKGRVLRSDQGERRTRDFRQVINNVGVLMQTDKCFWTALLFGASPNVGVPLRHRIRRPESRTGCQQDQRRYLFRVLDCETRREIAAERVSDQHDTVEFPDHTSQRFVGESLAIGV